MSRSYYDTYWDTWGWDTHPPPKLLDLLQRHVSPKDHCLDVGCGDGGTSGGWLQAHTAKYLGVDISESALAVARERGLDVEQIGDAAELPLADASFDCVVCTEVLEHLFEPQVALAEIHRVLRPEGRLIITVPNVAHWRNRLDLALLGRWNPRGDNLSPEQPWRDPHVRFFSLASLSRLVEMSAFEVMERGGHAQFGLAQHSPGLRSLARTPEAGSTTRRAAARFPNVLAESLYAVGRAT